MQWMISASKFRPVLPAITDLSLEEVAAKDLCEEVGATYERILPVSSFFSNSALTDEECHVFLALGVQLAHAPQPDAAEEIELIVKPAREVLQIARAGGMKTAPTTLALFMAEPMLRQFGLV